MRILYIAFQFPLSPNHQGGAASLYYDQLAALAELGHELDLWHVAYARQRPAFDAFVAQDAATWTQVQSWCRSVTLTDLPNRPNVAQKAREKWRTQRTGQYGFPLLRTRGSAELRTQLRRSQPDLIWAQHVWSAQISAEQSDVPFIYAHHDWVYRIKALRSGKPENADLRRTEQALVRQAAAVVSGSQTEIDELEQVGAQHCAYIPVSYAPVDIAWDAPESPRIVHLGGLGTTANFMGLQQFVSRVLPALDIGRDQFWIIGDATPAGGANGAWSQHATLTGFVPELDTVLRPYDIHIVPWGHATGQRTRVPLAFNYGQVVVAVRNAVAGFPEMADGVNCCLVDSLDDMRDVLPALMADRPRRVALGNAARQTFEQRFTRPALLPRYAALIARVTGVVQERV